MILCHLVSRRSKGEQMFVRSKSKHSTYITQGQDVRIKIVILTTHILLGQTWLLYLTTSVGLNMIQAAFTRCCPLAVVLEKLGVRPRVRFF